MTPIERAARALHKLYTEEKVRAGAMNMPTWSEMGDDGRFYFIHRVRAVLSAIREPSEPMLRAAGDCESSLVADIYATMIDAALAEGV